MNNSTITYNLTPEVLESLKELLYTMLFVAVVYLFSVITNLIVGLKKQVAPPTAGVRGPSLLQQAFEKLKERWTKKKEGEDRYEGMGVRSDG